MSVQFILGRSGTGKTSLCIKAIVNALLAPDSAQRLILLVPEQATYQAERAILADKRLAGYSSASRVTPHESRITSHGSRLNVLSFDRLQFLLLGKNTARPRLSRIGRQMIIHRILRDNKNRLKAFGSSATWPGLARQIAETVTELHQYAKTPDDIDQLLNELRKDQHYSLTALKFADIGLIFKQYLQFIEGALLDPDVQLNNARRAVASADFLKGAKLWVDGFAGFTTAELAILGELLKTVADAQVALCLDPSNINLKNANTKNIDTTSLFYPTECTYGQLAELVKKCELPLAEPVILDEPVRFSDSHSLAHIERQIFEPTPTRITAADNIRIVSAATQRAEVRFVARQIVRLVRENNYRYRDIAVIASDIDRYQHYIMAYFHDYGIPFFIDRRKPLNQHPAVGLICSALQTVTSGFSSSDIFAYLKSDLVPIERREVDLLENYCLAFGITGSDWTDGKDWHFAGDDEQFDEGQINRIRRKVSRPLRQLRDRLSPPNNSEKTLSAEQFTQIIFDFIDCLKVRETISEWIDQAQQNGDYVTVDEHRQFYDKLLNIFDELVEVFASQQMNCEDYFAIINSAFSQLTLAFIPPALDEVLVGSIERSRHPDLKAVFLIGTTQKQFPSPIVYSGILTDDDRGAAEASDFALAAATDRTLAERQYLAYIAFTRPSQFLCVTYPAVDDKGSAIARSQFIESIESLFENLAEESIADEKIDLDNIYTDRELADLLCSRIGKDAGEDEMDDIGRLLDGICVDSELAGLGAKVRSAIDYDNTAKLDETIVAQLSAGQTKSSATRLATFAACPYQYFARYVLDLEERKEFKLRPLEVGDFYHRVLDALLKQLNAEGKDFVTLQNDQLLKILRQQIVKIVSENRFISNFARHSAHNNFIIHSAGEVLEDCVLAIAQMVRAGSFRPAVSEVSFGRPANSDDTLGQYRISLPNGRELSLNGKIDRLDIAEADGEKTAIVFDYKKSKDKAYFNWTRFYHGLDMQLPIYMLAVRNAKGAFYMPVEINLPKVSLDELPKKTDSFNYKARGIFNGQLFRQLDGQACTGWNKFYNFHIAKEGDQYGNYGKSGALRPNDFEKVLKFTEKKIVELVKQILSGKIDVRPYRLGGKSPCGYCRYKSVCRFDWQINEYNFLEPLGKSEVLEQIGD